MDFVTNPGGHISLKLCTSGDLSLRVFYLSTHVHSPAITDITDRIIFSRINTIVAFLNVASAASPMPLDSTPRQSAEATVGSLVPYKTSQGLRFSSTTVLSTAPRRVSRMSGHESVISKRFTKQLLMANERLQHRRHYGANFTGLPTCN